eukprot:6058195-Prymnesium_polylepis.1
MAPDEAQQEVVQASEEPEDETLKKKPSWKEMRRHCSRCEFGRLPVQVAGIALNIGGFAGLLSKLATEGLASLPQFSKSISAFLESLSSVFLVESTTLQMVCLARMLLLVENVHGTWRSTFLREVRSRRVTAAQCALLVAMQLTGGQLYTKGLFGGQVQSAAVGIIYTAAAANWLLTAYFLSLSWMRRTPVEPFWFPATVSLATFAVAGAPIGEPHFPRGLLLFSLWTGTAVSGCLWPWCVYRTLRYPEKVAPDPSVFVLMAPVPFVTMAMFACRPHQGE